ncbi:MAG: hypothetical protein EXS59_01840 [Candidatus Taylorbacteria bacterium]|nr:hypothetical protein [Candidatus Taylorbacteria bacterium]
MQGDLVVRVHQTRYTHFPILIQPKQSTKGNLMAYYSTFVFQLPGCPEIRMSTRYDIIQDFDQLRGLMGGPRIATRPFYKPGRQMCTAPTAHEQYPRVMLTKWQRRKIQTFLNVIYRSGIHKIPRRCRKFIMNNGVFPQEVFQDHCY